MRHVILLLSALVITSPLLAQSTMPNPSVLEKEGESSSQPVKAVVEPIASDQYVAKTAFALDKSVSKGDSLGVPSKKKAQPDADDGWQFAFAPYLYMTGLSGTVGARGRVVEIDASFGSILENLSFGLMGTFEARKGRFVSATDMIWTKMSVERNTPGALYNTAKIDTNLFIFDPEIGYRLAEGKAGSFDVLGGVRIWSVENTLNLSTGTLPGFDVRQRKTWFAPVGGVHGTLNLSPRFYLATKADIGAGSGTDITTQFYGGAGFRVSPRTSLIGGYRFLKVNHDDESGFVFNTHMSGFVLGAKFAF